eukprot:1173152-Prorocentrum_minimum.AAC.6
MQNSKRKAAEAQAAEDETMGTHLGLEEVEQKLMEGTLTQMIPHGLVLCGLRLRGLSFTVCTITSRVHATPQRQRAP